MLNKIRVNNLAQKQIKQKIIIELNSKRQMLKFVIKGKSYEIPKDVLRQEMKTSENSQLQKKNIIELPSWVQKNEFQFIYAYLNIINATLQQSHQQRTQKINTFFTNSVKQQSQNQTKTMIQIMRISDYLTLEKFQQILIQQSIIKTLNTQNCIVYLQETHKKLKNSSSGSGAAQAWYSLLNSCIDFISFNLTEVYLKQPERIQKLHQKILSEILDRTIKYQIVSNSNPPGSNKSLNDNSKDKEIIFNLLMKSKKVNSVDSFCNSLKSTLLNKKINKKMHAKLSWKLHDLQQIKDKKVKNFKFLDLNWVLEAIRTQEGKLKIKLTLLRSEEQIKGNSSTYHIGVFYSKLYWSMDSENVHSNKGISTPNMQKSQQSIQGMQTSGEESLTINYISFKNPSPIDIFEISKQFQVRTGHKKLQLSIYCSIDQCYSFVINYIINNYNQIRLDEKKIQKQQIYALIQGFKSSAKYSQAVWLIKYLAKSQLEIPLNILQNLPLDKLPTYQAQFIRKLVRNDNVILDEVFGKKEQSLKSVQIENDANSLTNSKVSDNLETRSNHSRAPSRGRHRKIFGESPQKSTQPVFLAENLSSNNSIIPQSIENDSILSELRRKKEQELREISQIIDLRNYFYDKNSPLLTSIL